MEMQGACEINVRIFKIGQAGEFYGLGRRQKTRDSGGLWQWPYARQVIKGTELSIALLGWAYEDGN